MQTLEMIWKKRIDQVEVRQDVVGEQDFFEGSWAQCNSTRDFIQARRYLPAILANLLASIILENTPSYLWECLHYF